MKSDIKNILLNPIMFLTRIIDKIGDWVFEYATRVIELLNTWCLIGFGTVMLSNSVYLLKVDLYGNFVKVPSIVWMSMVMLGFIQFILLCRTTNASNQLSGIVLQFSGLVWLIIAMAFAFQPPVSTALPIYTGIGVIFSMTGYELLRTSKKLEE